MTCCLVPACRRMPSRSTTARGSSRGA
jgi:hypothetical protein